MLTLLAIIPFLGKCKQHLPLGPTDKLRHGSTKVLS